MVAEDAERARGEAGEEQDQWQPRDQNQEEREPVSKWT